MPARFSEMLVNRRRQLGMTVQQIANVIKIRPQILESFEAGDFSNPNMPPRGYAQGMISSYARYLGLNPRDVVGAYLDDLGEFERSTSGSHAGNYIASATEPIPRRGTAGGYAAGTSANLTGTRYTRRIQPTYGEDDMRLGAGETQRMQRPVGQGSSPRSGRPPQGQRRRSAGGEPPRRRPQNGRPGTAPRGRDPRRGARGGRPTGPFSDPRVLIAALAAVLLVIVIIVIFAVRSCTAAPDEANQPATVPVSTVSTAESPESPASDNSSADSPESPETDDSAALPTEYKVVVTVADGETAWLEIKNDGKVVYADRPVGPLDLGYTVTGSLEISTDNVDAVSVTRDGQTVDYDSKSGGIGKITITVPKPETPATDDEAASDEQSADDGTASASE